MFVIAPLVLAHLVATCAPRIGPLTMSAVVVYESGARPNAIGDNTERRAYYPADRAAAERLASTLLRAGHNLDVGYAQLNSANFARLGLGVREAFDPCRNIAAGASLLEDAYRGATQVYGPGQNALAHALSAYNTGGYRAGLGYAAGVYAAAARLRAVPLLHARAPRSYATL